jgi:hypothetical protein
MRKYAVYNMHKVWSRFIYDSVSVYDTGDSCKNTQSNIKCKMQSNML